MTIGPYELLETLGQGGMGTVYRATNRVTGEVVAVKVISADLGADPVLLRRFKKECAAARRLAHPNIVRGLDFDLECNQPYLVMEYVDGPNLGQKILEDGPLSEATALDIGITIAEALQIAHEHKLIHRDVKPENVLLARNGQAKLTDLGLIKDLNATTILTRPRECLGTITFMAPEQFESADHADALCDVYGLAGTLYFILSGIVPFPGRGNLTIVQKKIRNDFVPLSRLLPALPAAIDRLITRALDCSPAQRPGSCAEFASILRACVRGPNAGRSDPSSSTRRSPTDRRQAVRYPSNVRASCRHFSGRDTTGLALVQDVSQTGICLQLERAFQPGELLGLELSEQDQARPVFRIIRVCWVREGTGGRWRHGCAFQKKLREDELNAVLGNEPSTVVIRTGRNVTL